jgi:predicted DNA-binding transcriptional regulator YafY
MSRYERLFALDAAIRAGSYPSLRALMERFEVSERTIYDDLAYLRERFDAPLRYERSRGGYTYSDPSWQLPPVLMTEGELVAFFLSVELTRRYLGTAFEAPLRKALATLAGTLPDTLSVDLAQLAQHYTFEAGATANADPQLLITLLDCIREQWPLAMTYLTASSGERKERVIEPYHLFNVRGDWQVMAFDHLRQGVRQFAVSRIEAWEVLKEQRFVRDPDFSVSDYLSTAFLAERGDHAEIIEIWFDAYQTRYLRGRMFRPDQQVTEHVDGSMTLRFQSGALDEIRRWVMSYGSHARVVAPAILVEQITNELDAARRMYQSA